MTETTTSAAGFRPADLQELTGTLAWAVAERQPLEVVAGGTKRAIGRPMQAEAVLDLSRLAGIRDYDPPELVLTCGAATPMAEIAAALAEAGQMLAFEPMDAGPLFGADAGGGTLGGTISADLAGPRRIKAGAARDHLLGFEGATGRGEAFKAGGRVVKNVTGYDIAKLVTGAWGTLVAFDLLSVKVLPAPETTATLLIAGLDPARARAAMADGLNSSHEVSAAAHLPGSLAARVDAVAAAGDAVTALRLEGFETSVAARAEALTAELGRHGAVARLDDAASRALWADIRDVRPFAPPQTELAAHAVWRISVPPTCGPAVAAAIAARADAECFFDWAGGLIWASVAGADDGGAAVVRAAVAAESETGHATLVRAPAPIRAAVPVFQPQPGPLAALAARLKDQFDPHRVLNPGRMAAGL